MQRATKWKAENNKVKVVFRLQLQATQVPQPGWEKLFVSLIPVETGKAIAKTTKVSVRNGSCKWSDPIYETTRLLQDMKTRKFDAKLYKLAVSTGSSRYGFLGEANINLAEYAEAVKPSTVTLPLQSCNFGTILHVTVQPLTANTGFREFEQQRELTERGFRLSENGDDEPDGNAFTSEEKIDGHGVKEKPRPTSTTHKCLDSLEVSSIQPSNEANKNYRGCATDDAILNSNPENNYTAKQEDHEVCEIGGITNGISRDAATILSLSQISKPPPKSSNNSSQVQASLRQAERSSGEWTHGWSSDYSTENDAANVYEENERLRANLQTSESSIMHLKTEVASLEKQAEGQALEIEKLMQQLATEIKQGQDFARKISDLKLESDSVKSEFEQLKALGKAREEQKQLVNGWLHMGHTDHILEDLKKELDSEKQTNINLNLQLEKSQRAYSELLLSFQGDLLENNTEEIGQISNIRLQALVLEGKKQGPKGSEIDWLQMLTASEDKIRQIKEKIVLKDDGRILAFLEDDLEVLERVFQEFRQGSIRMIGKLNASHKRITELDPDMQNLPEVFLPRNILTNMEINGCKNRISYLHLGKDKTENCYEPFQQKTFRDLQSVQEMLLQHDRVQLNLENLDQFSENAEKINRFDISELELELSEAKQQLLVLSASNIQLETRIKGLEEEKLVLQNRLTTFLTRERNGKLMEEALTFTGKDCGSGTNRSSDMLNDQEDIYIKMFHLREHNSQVVERISQIDTEQHDTEKDSVQFATVEVSEEFRKSKSYSYLELEKRIQEISAEAEVYKRARDSLANEMEQLQYKYEALVRELEDRVAYLGHSEKQLQEQLGNIRDEHAASLYSISNLESQVEKLKQELDKQAASYATHRDEMTLSKVELEQRANRAEVALKKTRWNNANIVEQLQKELERLSLQISSTFDANEKLATHAFAEAYQLRVQKNELEDQLTIVQEILQKTNEEIVVTRQQGEANVQELISQLSLSKKSEEELLSKVQNLCNELENQIKCQADYIRRNEELSARILTLEGEVQALLNEKISLIEKAEEFNVVKAELESTKISLDGCQIERTGLEASLQRATQVKIKLEEELISLKYTMKNSDAELDELKCCKDLLQNKVALLQSTSESQLADKTFHIEQKDKFMELHSQHSELKQSLLEQELETAEMKHLLISQKELQQKTVTEVSQLHTQKNSLEEYSMGLQEALQNAKAENAFIKGQYEDKVQELMTQLDLSNKQREELFSRLQNAWNDNEKWMSNEANYMKRSHELSSRISMLETELQAVLKDKRSLTQRVKECDSMMSDLEKNKLTLDTTKVENADLKLTLQKVKQERGGLENELLSLREALEDSDRELDELKCSRNELEITVAFLKSKLDDQDAEISLGNEQKAELIELQRQHNELKNSFSEQELKKEDLMKHLVNSNELLQKADVEASQLYARKNDLENQLSVIQELLQKTNASMTKQFEAKVQELDRSENEREELLLKLQNALSDLEIQTKSEANCLRVNEEMSMRISMLETEVETALTEKREFLHKVEECKTVRVELERHKRSLEDSLERANEEKAQFNQELGSLKEMLRNSDSEVDELKHHRDELQIEVTFLQSKVEEQNSELVQLHREYGELKHRFSEQVLKTEELKKNLVHSQELLQKADVEVYQLHTRKNELEKQLSEFEELLQVANSENASMRKQFEAKVQSLVLSTETREELSSKLQNALSELEIQKKSEANCLRENKELSIEISLLETEVETALKENRELFHKVEEFEAVRAELESNTRSLNICSAEKAELENSLGRANKIKGELDKELGFLKEMLRNSDSELDGLKCHRNELEISVTFLQSKVDEQNDELMQLRSELSQLKYSLSEQEVKIEELRRHSIQLQELQQKAEVAASQLRVQKKELEEHSIMVQESLRIAFIREQFEGKEQELLNQLNMEKIHREDILSKLQETMNELEIQKSSEKHYRKKAEELSVRFLSLETELQSVLKENNGLLEKVKECNEVKSEFEVNKTSLQNCKAEKAQLEQLLQRVNVEKEQLDAEICSLKEMLRYSDVELDELKCCKDKLETEMSSLLTKQGGQDAQISLNEDEKNELMQLRKQESVIKNRLLEQQSKAEDMEKHISHLEKELLQKADALVKSGRKLKKQDNNTKATDDDTPGELKSKIIALEASWKEFSGNEKKLQNYIDKGDMTDEHLNEETLNSSMDRLHKELEKMKRDNLAPFQQENELLCESDPQEPLQKEMEQLQMVNKQLENMFPCFKEPARGGNVIDRVLALERELAVALKANDAKKRQFQSSFIKQQADQAAMLQSFRDINELINDMLEVKRKNSVLEDELKELQSRYSQVSLQFAEVEGERQQLVMIVKNLRGAKKT